MSRAFTRERDDIDALPDREISPHANYVTVEGLDFIQAEVSRLSREFAEAQAAGDRSHISKVGRDLKYWRRRRASAQIIETLADRSSVQFGSGVTIERDDGTVQNWRVVGEDEANPAKGTLSYVAPLARALMNKVVGDRIETGRLGGTIKKIW